MFMHAASRRRLLYGMREADMIEGVQPINPLDVLDATLTAYRAKALVIATWTL